MTTPTSNGGGQPSTSPAASPTPSKYVGSTASDVSYSGLAFGTQAPVQHGPDYEPPHSSIEYQAPQTEAEERGPQPRAFHGRNFDGAPADALRLQRRRQIRCAIIITLTVCCIIAFIVAVYYGIDAANKSSTTRPRTTTREPYPWEVENPSTRKPYSWERTRFKVENGSKPQEHKIM